MRRYWDLTERQRSELTAEALDEYKSVELMEAGAPVAARPELRPVPDVSDVPKVTYYCVIDPENKYENIGDVLFETEEEASAFAKLNPMKKDYEYSIGSDYYYGKPYPRLAVERIELYRHDDLVPLQDLLVERKEATKANEEANRAYDKTATERRDALAALLSNYDACTTAAHRVEEVRQTLSEYVATAGGDVDTAGRFVLKAYDADRIEEAIAWGVEGAGILQHAVDAAASDPAAEEAVAE